MYHAGLGNHLRSHDFQPSETDQCLYIWNKPEIPVIAAVTTDDLLILEPSAHLLHAFHRTIVLKYRVTDFGSPVPYLGWRISRTETDAIHDGQPDLAAEALADSGLTEATPRTSRIPKHTSFISDSFATHLPVTETLPFQSLLADLRNFGDCTHPDLSFATARLARYIHHPPSTTTSF